MVAIVLLLFHEVRCQSGCASNGLGHNFRCLVHLTQSRMSGGTIQA